MPMSFCGALVGLVISGALDRVPQPMRDRAARVLARIVARLPGGAWPAVLICGDE